MPTPPGNADPNLNIDIPGYDPIGHQANVAVRVVNIQTDATTGLIYGDMATASGGTGTQAVSIADGSDVAEGSKADTAVTNPALSGSEIAILKGLLTYINGLAFDQTNRLKVSLYVDDNTPGDTPLNCDTNGNLFARQGAAASSSASPWYVVLTSDYPSGATPITSSSGNVANASAVATLAGTSGKTTYITGFQVSGSGAVAGLPVIVTATNLISGTNSYIYSAIAGVLLENTPLFVQFKPAIPANAANTSIVVSCPALGTGNTNNVVNAQGYQL